MGLAMIQLAAATPAQMNAQASDRVRAALRGALTFYASFDHGFDADYARGDRSIYSAVSFAQARSATPGVANPDVVIAKGQGRFGDALLFRRKNTQAVFFKAERNVAFRAHDWNGTISFWLNLSPDTDLEPGYTDPLQITDKAYNNAAIWVDFTRDQPRHFRLGVFGDASAWNPNNLSSEANPSFDARTVVVTQPRFVHGQWTNVVITFAGLNTQGGGTAKLYLNGRPMGTATGIREPFTWDISRASIRLGVNYVGLWDELSLFDRALTDSEVDTLYHLERGVASLR